jgi:hypothetical protein
VLHARILRNNEQQGRFRRNFRWAHITGEQILRYGRPMNEERRALVRTDGVLGIGGVVGCLGGAPLGECGGALGGRVLVAGGGGREEDEEDEEERRRHGSGAFAGMLASVNCEVGACDASGAFQLL